MPVRAISWKVHTGLKLNMNGLCEILTGLIMMITMETMMTTTMMMTMMIFAVPTFKGSILLSINFKIIKHRYII